MLETPFSSDMWKGYDKLDQTFETHHRVNNSQHEYVGGAVSNNGIEGFWGYLQEGFLKYHGISPRNFSRYLKEVEFCFNRRYLTPGQFYQSLADILMKPITP